jgi:hypothetical protein
MSYYADHMQHLFPRQVWYDTELALNNAKACTFHKGEAVLADGRSHNTKNFDVSAI